MNKGPPKEMIGLRFGRLVVLRQNGKMYGDQYAWLCQCDCGEKTTVCGHSLRAKRSTSCGCLSREVASARSLKHGATVGGVWALEYRSYQKMKERCLNSNHKHYSNYGGRGVIICQRWLDGFDNFLSDMGSKPTPSHTLDRINTYGNYEPENCRWATRKEQNQNSRIVLPVLRSDGVLYPSASEAARAVSGCINMITKCCRVPGKNYRGYGWSFAGMIGVKRDALENANSA